MTVEVTLEAGPVLLRPWAAADRAGLAAQANHVGVWRNMTNRFPHPYTLRDAVQWIAAVEQTDPPQHFAAALDGAVVGGAGIVPIADYGGHAAEVGYWLGPDHWGRGYATEMLAALIRYGFHGLGMERLHATVFGWNEASVRVLDKNGFIAEGRLRGAVSKAGERTDLVIFGLLKSDYGGGGAPAGDR